MRSWRTTVPLAALAILVFSFVATRVSVRREVPLVISPPPAADLPALTWPPRAEILKGRVLAAGGAGVPDALVFLRAGDEPHWTYTRADGAFLFDSLGPPPWTAFVLARGFAPKKLALADAAAGRAIDLGPPLEPPPSLAKLARSPLAGRVASSVKSDLEGCEIVLTPVLPPETIDAPVPRRARVDGEGRFAFDALIAGEYRVEVLPAWAVGGSWPDLARALDAREPLVLAHPRGEAAGELAIALACGEIRGAVADPGGAPLEGTLVVVSPAGDPGRVWPPISTGADGVFLARDLPAGKYRVGVRAGAGRAELDVEVRAGETASASFANFEVRRAR